MSSSPAVLSNKSRLAILLEHFATIDDPRDVRRISHPLAEILLLVVCGTIADCDDYDHIAAWGETHLDFLRRHLPDAMPLSGLSICAVADRVVVKEGARRWQAESGQYLLAFEGDPANGSLSVMAPKRAAPKASANDWFDRGIDLEETDSAAALEAYAEALKVDPKLVDAHVNRGWLLHEAGRFGEAERAYRAAIAACGDEPLVLYNLGVLLADMERKKEAIEVYEAALRGNPGFADCHYNLALLCEELGMPREAIRHMAQYRKLTGSRPSDRVARSRPGARPTSRSS